MRVINSHSGVSMRLLLLNNNPAVSRLIKLSAEKAGYELDEFEDYGLVPLTIHSFISCCSFFFTFRCCFWNAYENHASI